ncbi:MAG: peptidylprolyl isomerase [Legionella sp.]|nr:MAG: peptidylprolyl isomerase [Legionella sp.]
MLQKLNERIQGAVAWIIVILVTLTFTLFGLDYYLQSRHESVAKARVNGQAISKQEYELNYRRLSQTQESDTLTPANEQALKQQVLSEMIANAVRVDSAKAQGFEVTAHQAGTAIVHIPQFQEDGHFSTSRYTQALSNAFFTPQTFEQEVRQGMLLNQQRFALIGSAFILPNELSQFIKLSMQTREYQYALIQAEDFKSTLTVSEQEMQQYYQAHKEQFLSKEQVSIDYIRLSMSDIKKTISISSDQAMRAYEDNKANYLTPAQWKLSYVRFPIGETTNIDEAQAKHYAEKLYKTALAAPQQFDAFAQEAVAQEHAVTGLLPTVTAGQSTLDTHLMNLTTPGQISEPIRTAEGYEVLQLKAYQAAAVQPFQDVKNLIIEQLTQEAAQKLYADFEDRLSELSYQNPDSLEPVAEALHVPVLHSSLFTADEMGKDEITQQKMIVQTAFSHDVLVFGNNSEPLQLDADTLVVLRVNQHIPTALQIFDLVKPSIQAELLKQKSILAAQQFGQNIIQQSPRTQPELHWQASATMTRDSDAIDSQINEVAFSIAKINGYGGSTLNNGDFVVVRLTKVDEGKMDASDKEQLANITQQLEANYGLMDYDLYISQLMSQAKIVKY